MVRELLRGEYLDKKENVLFIGNPGTGKTHVVCALAFSACAHGRSVRFYMAMDLVTQLGECRQEPGSIPNNFSYLTLWGMSYSQFDI